MEVSGQAPEVLRSAGKDVLKVSLELLEGGVVIIIVSKAIYVEGRRVCRVGERSRGSRTALNGGLGHAASYRRQVS